MAIAPLRTDAPGCESLAGRAMSHQVHLSAHRKHGRRDVRMPGSDCASPCNGGRLEAGPSGRNLASFICRGSGSQGRKGIHPGGHDVMSAGGTWRSGCERAGQFPGSHSREIVVRMFEHFVSSRQNASSDIARPEQTQALVAPCEELSCPRDGSAEARPLPLHHHFVRG